MRFALCDRSGDTAPMHSHWMGCQCSAGGPTLVGGMAGCKPLEGGRALKVERQSQ